MTQEAKALIGIVAATLLILFGGIFLLSKSSPTPTTTNTQSATIAKENLIRDDSYKIATPTAKVTIVEFADFQCPACAAAHPTLKQLRQEYQGRVNFVFRHFPLLSHRYGQIAAEAAEAAGKQGKFFEMHDMLLENQQEWSESDKPIEQFIQYTKKLNLDADQFKKDVDSNAFFEKVRRDVNDGNVLGVNSTPTFFINEEKVTGVLPIDTFRSKINAALNNN